MDIAFADDRLRSLCNETKKLRRQFGPKGEKLIRQRLDELSASATLAVVRSLPGPRCEELKGNRAGYLSVRVHDGFRIIFSPAEPVVRKPDGGLDWTATTAIEILSIEDYHD